MTLDEAIKQCEEAAEDRAKLSKRCDDASGYSRSRNEAIRTNEAKEHEKCSQDFRQLAEWLRELKAYKKQEPCEDAISRDAALEAILTRVPDFCGGDEGGNLVGRNETASYIRNLPSVTPEQKTGKWIPVSEKLPEDLEPVNITWVNHEPEPYYHEIKDKNFVATAIHYRDQWYWYSTTCADYLGEYGSNEIDLVDDAVEIVAWMPLPEPYKEREDKN